MACDVGAAAATSPWADEGNRLLDDWSVAQARVNALHRMAERYREQLTLANDRCREAREKFDLFMHGCMRVRSDAADPGLVPVDCDCDCGTACPQGRTGSATKCTIMKLPEAKPGGA